MIQANELRIGNLLNYDTAEGDILTTTIDWQDLKWISEDPKGFNLVHTPISLTEEWLVKFGFQRFKKGFIKNNICIAEYYGGGLTIFLSNEKFDFKVDLYSVHQFQNLYFALTSEELTIKNNLL